MKIPLVHDMEQRRRLIILMLVGLIVILAFSLFALYDFYFSYERSTDPISYENEEYIEFYIYTTKVDFVPGEEFNLSVGVANFLGAQKNLTVYWGEDASNGSRHDFKVLDKEVKTLDFPVFIDKGESTVIYFELRDENGGTVSVVEREFCPAP